jgi:hypothetical protein
LGEICGQKVAYTRDLCFYDYLRYSRLKIDGHAACMDEMRSACITFYSIKQK